MNVYKVDLWSQAIALLLYATTIVALFALLVGVGWLVCDYLMNQSMPYRDPEALAVHVQHLF